MLSILTVNYNSGPRLKAWCEDLAAHPPSVPYEVVIVENASTDGSADFLRRDPPARVRVLWLPKNRLYTAAMNAAYGDANGDTMLLLNPDVRPRPGAIDAMLARLESDASIGAVAGQTLRPDTMAFERYVNRLPRPYDIYLTQFVARGKAERNAGFRRYHMLDDDLDGVCDVEQPAGHCFLIRRDIFGEALMSDGFGLFFSDVEVATKIALAGKRIVLEPTAQFVHDHDRTTRPPSETSVLVDLDYYEGCARYFRLYRGLGAWLQVKLLFGARLLGRLVVIELPSALRGEQTWRLWRHRAKALAWFLAGRNVLLERALQ